MQALRGYRNATFHITLLSVWALLLLSFPANASEKTLFLSTTTPKQGGFFELQVVAPSPLRHQKLSFQNRSVTLFKDPSSTKTRYVYRSFVGVSRKKKASQYPIWIKLKFYDGTQWQTTRKATVKSGGFRKEHIKLSKKKNKLARDYTSLNNENKELAQTYKTNTMRLYLDGVFTVPVKEARITSGFGNTRVYNGKPAWPHSGVDFGKALGAEIVAANRGQVSLVQDYKVHGKTILIDHGWGIVSTYNHLHTTSVKVGDMVKKDQVIGTMGKTGIATGPHLHWGISLQNVRVNPMLFLVP
jgi:murein DD-endopeptidase MepM/ murein hydrolase activator NlpD